MRHILSLKTGWTSPPSPLSPFSPLRVTRFARAKLSYFSSLPFFFYIFSPSPSFCFIFSLLLPHPSTPTPAPSPPPLSFHIRPLIEWRFLLPSLQIFLKWNFIGPYVDHNRCDVEYVCAFLNVSMCFDVVDVFILDFVTSASSFKEKRGRDNTQS